MNQNPPSAMLDILRNGKPMGSFDSNLIPDLINNGQLELTDEYQYPDGTIVKLSHLLTSLQSSSTQNSTPPAVPTGPKISRFQIVLFCLCLVSFLGLITMILVSNYSESLFPNPTNIQPAASRDRDELIRSLSELELKITELIGSSFNTKKSDIDGKIAYTHKFYSSIGNRIILRASVNNSGECQLYTYYSAKEWLFLRQISFQIGRDTFTTSRLNSYEPKREASMGKGIYESCTFKSDSDREIIRKISLNTEQDINMKLIGQVSIDKKVSYETKVAIKDSLKLSELLTERTKKLQSLSLLL
jgi:hypothetical protein